MFVFFQIKVVNVPKSKLDRLDEAVQTIHDTQIVGTGHGGGIVKGWEGCHGWGPLRLRNGWQGVMQTGVIGRTASTKGVCIGIGRGRSGPVVIASVVGIHHHVVVIVANTRPLRTGGGGCDKAAIGLRRRSFQVQDLPGTNEKLRIGSFGRLRTAVKTHNGKFAHLVIELVTKARQLSEIEWSKIQKEIPIDQFLIHVEEMNLPLFLGQGGIAFGCRGQDIVTGRRLFQGGIIQAFL